MEFLGKYQLKADNLNLTISERRMREAKPEDAPGKKANPENIGKPYWWPLAHFSLTPNGYRSALAWLAAHEVSECDLENLKQIADKQDEILGAIDALPISKQAVLSL